MHVAAGHYILLALSLAFGSWIGLSFLPKLDPLIRRGAEFFLTRVKSLYKRRNEKKQHIEEVEEYLRKECRADTPTKLRR